jgi:hypothetical protein
VTVLHGICLLAAGAALTAALAIGEPDVYGPLALCALVLFIVGAGSIAADAVPMRSRLALLCSALTPVAAVGLATAGFAGVPPLVAVIPPLLVTVTPFVAGLVRPLASVFPGRGR